MAILPYPTQPMPALPGNRWAPRIYPGETAQAARVRADLRTDLGELPGITEDLVETMVLCASEAFANAAEHTRSGDPGGRVVRALHIPAPGTIRLVIIDDGDRGNRPEVPHTRSAEEWDSAENGRGLLLVESLTTAWGATPVVTFPFCAELGTSVWAEFPLNPH